jgi:cell division protein FtsN
MSRDYKPSSKPSGRKGGNPMLTGILIGLFAGLGIALGVALFINTMPSPFAERGKPAGEAQPQAGTPKAVTDSTIVPEKTEKSADKPRFDFYQILPGTEEPVSEQELKEAKPGANGAKDSYYLQVGSFQTEAEADNLKARLALLGVEAVIQTATLPEKGIWHRVRVGPYNNIDDINRVRATLSQNSIESSLIKTKEAGPH